MGRESTAQSMGALLNRGIHSYCMIRNGAVHRTRADSRGPRWRLMTRPPQGQKSPAIRTPSENSSEAIVTSAPTWPTTVPGPPCRVQGATVVRNFVVPRVLIH